MIARLSSITRPLITEKGKVCKKGNVQRKSMARWIILEVGKKWDLQSWSKIVLCNNLNTCVYFNGFDIEKIIILISSQSSSIISLPPPLFSYNFPEIFICSWEGVVTSKSLIIKIICRSKNPQSCWSVKKILSLNFLMNLTDFGAFFVPQFLSNDA